MTQREIVQFLLETYNEAREVQGNTRDKLGRTQGPGDHIPLMSQLWRTGSYQQLEQLLSRMSQERPSQHWHIRQRYLEATDRVIEVRMQKRRNERIPILPPHTETRGKPAIITGTTARIAVRQYNPAVRLDKVRKGVDWLTEQFHGRAQLPTLLLEAV